MTVHYSSMRSLGVLLLMLVTVTAQGDGNCTDGDFELIQDDGRSEIVGYVRYCRNGQWRSVCRRQEHHWDSNEARVACSQLGYQVLGEGYGVGCPSDANLGNSTINDAFVVVQCDASLNGTESSLQDCILKDVTSCRCGRAARLRCDPADCTNDEIRLVGGSTDREGRVEVCVGGRWGTVQTNNPGELAQTVCEPLTEYLEFYSTASCYVSQFGYSVSKPVYSCSLNNTGGVMCHNHTSDSHERDLAVVCRNSNTQCGAFNLVDDDLTCVEQGLAVNYTAYQELLANDSLCGVHQQGHYRVQNGAVLHECVDQQWTTVDNTSQLLTVVQEDIDQLINKSLTTQCPTTPPDTETTVATNSTEKQPVSESGACIGINGALAVALLATAAGWLITCVVVRKKCLNKPSYSLPDVAETENAVYYPHQVQDNQFYEEARRPNYTYSSAGPNYDTVTINQESPYDVLPPLASASKPDLNDYDSIPKSVQPSLDTYDVIRTVEPPPAVQSSSSVAVREEATDQFHNVEEHVYAAVNKDKKASEEEKLDLAVNEEAEFNINETPDSN